jgi:hypothetical protein
MAARQFLDTSASLIQCATHGALFLMKPANASPAHARAKPQALPGREDEQGLWVQL